MEIKCLTNCPYLFNSDDIIIMCQINGEYCGDGICVGLKDIDSKLEELQYNYNKLMVEYNRLSNLKDFILDNQN